MNKIVLSLCGLWFWITHKRRAGVYREAAATLELAHNYLLRDFASRASTRDRGLLVPYQSEALAMLERHAMDSYALAESFASLRSCCRHVVEVLAPRPAPAPVRITSLQPRYATFRIRFTSARAFRFSLNTGWLPALAAGLFRAQTFGSLWKAQAVLPWRVHKQEPALAVAASPEQELPLKAA